MEPQTEAQQNIPESEILGDHSNVYVYTVHSAEEAQTIDSEITPRVDIKLYDLDGVFNRNRRVEMIMLNLEMAMLRWLQSEVLGGKIARRYVITSRQEIFQWSPWIGLLQIALNPHNPLSVPVLSLTNPDVIEAVSHNSIPNVAIFTDSGKQAKERLILRLTKPFVARYRRHNGHPAKVTIDQYTFQDTLSILAYSSERGLSFMDNDRTVFDIFLAIADSYPDKLFYYINIDTSRESLIPAAPQILRTALLQITGISLERLKRSAK